MIDSCATKDRLVRLSSLCVLDLDGKDAEAILHNLTTNQIKTLQVDGVGTESFVTNVKGKCLGHVLVFRTPTGFRLIGAGASQDRPSQSEAIAAHADRYTIREDAVPHVKDSQFDAWLLVSETHPLNSPALSAGTAEIHAKPIPVYGVPWVRTRSGRAAQLMLVPSDGSLSGSMMLDSLSESAAGLAAGLAVVDGDEGDAMFHSMRITTGFPWYGIDVDETHLPQEVGREPLTISFTKGCYLGQETVARLDALGQVQKMLVAWSIELPADHPLPPVDTKLFAGGEKPVGRLTSLARGSDNQVFALGYARRSHFEPGAIATGTIGETNFSATVMSLAAEQGV